MLRLIFRYILFVILSFLFFVPPTDAGVPVPSEVADNIVEPEQTELILQRAELLIRRDSIKLGVAIHNAKCSKITPGSSIVDECRTNQKKLQTDISAYTAYVLAFNNLIQEVPRLTETGLDPWLSNKMLYYFLINRDENYTIHNAIMRNMIYESKSGPQEHLASPLDEREELRDREILIPIDYELKVNLSQVLQIIKERQGARGREAARKSSNRINEIMKRLVEEGVLEPGESVIDKKKNDPVFRESLNNMLSNITRNELMDLRSARSLALEEMVRMIETRSTPSKYQEFHEILQEIYERRDIALDMINKFAFRKMSEEIDRLKQEGYYKDGDDLIEKDRYDRDFRDAVNEAVRNILIKQYKAEQNIQLKTVNEIQSTVNKLGWE